jgi:3-deoxy-manno-octulosonate cytidylyltransferase (CMP-KDO synthetase)
VNLQGDEIPLDPDLLADLIEPFVESGAEMGTLKRPIASTEDLHNPAVVKVVTDQQGQALYFSRAPIPLVRDDPAAACMRGCTLFIWGSTSIRARRCCGWRRCRRARWRRPKSLEQLRALEHGIPIRVWETKHESLRVDTPADADSVSATLHRLERNRQAQASIRI